MTEPERNSLASYAAAIGPPIRAALEGLLVTLASVGFALSYGWNYGVDNQVVYFLEALHMVHGVLGKDWFASSTTQYHMFFKYLAAPLVALSERGVAVGVATTVIIAGGMGCIYALLRVLAGRRAALGGFAAVVGLAWLTRTNGPMSTYVFDEILQPSLVASFFLLAAVPFFARGQWLAAGACIAGCGLFHANFLLLSMASCFFAHLALGQRGFWPRAILTLILPSLVLLFFIPTILRTAGSPDAARAQEIYVHIRAPHHFVTAGRERDFFPLAGWSLLGLGAAGALGRGRSEATRVAALVLGMLVMVWGGLAAWQLTDKLAIAQLFAWRIAPHATLLLQAITLAWAARSIFERAEPVPPAGAAAMVAGLGVVCVYYADRETVPIAWLLLAVAALIAVARLVASLGGGLPLAVRRPLSKSWHVVGGFLAMALLFQKTLKTIDEPLGKWFEKRSTVFSGPTGPSRNDLDLYAWMRTQPKDAQFLTPPDQEGIRYMGQRPIVVDWKSNPVVPSEILEWYRRLGAVTGNTSIDNRRDLSGYDRMDAERLEKLKAEFKLRFAIVRRGREQGLGDYPVVFSSPRFVVIDLAKSGGAANGN